MDNYEGKNIKLLKMDNDPFPIPVGTKGKVISQQTIVFNRTEETHLSVEWENGRTLKVILPFDEVEII